MAPVHRKVDAYVRSLPTSPRNAVTAARRAGRLWRWRPRSLGFPFTTPTWPGSVDLDPERQNIGAGYETAWARRYPARLGRAMLIDDVARPLIKLWADPRIEGDDRLAGLDGPVIFVANHASHLDSPLLITSLPSRFRHKLVAAAAADYFFDTKLKAVAAALVLNAVPIERSKISRRAAELPADLIRDGWSLLIFPEGGRTPDGWGQEHRGGAAYLAGKTGAPIVPIHLEGTRRVLRKGRFLPRPSSTSVTFGAPLRANAAESSRSFQARIERAIEVLADEQRHGFWEAKRRAAAGETPTLRGPQASSWRRNWTLGEGRRRPSKGPVWPPR